MVSHRETIAVAMSGGVDSSVAAALLVQRGHRVIGLTMRLFCYRDVERARSCCSLDSIDSARAVAARLGFPHYVVDCQREFKRRVIDRFINEYRRGRTPNPCVDCNRHIKFGLLWRKARQMGCSRLATGHYARIKRLRGRPMLAQAADETKDQSYFLWNVEREALAHAVFPLGTITKAQTRQKARQYGLTAAGRAESQEICFVQQGSYADFLEASARAVPGDIVSMEGEMLGRHRGIIRYTIGQRQGLGIAAGKPLYVVSIDADNNRIIVGEDGQLRAKSLQAQNTNWFIDPYSRRFKALVRIRHQHRAAPAAVQALSGDRAAVAFDEPQRAVAPGQSAVFYRNGLVLGGGVIV